MTPWLKLVQCATLQESLLLVSHNCSSELCTLKGNRTAFKINDYRWCQRHTSCTHWTNASLEVLTITEQQCACLSVVPK